MLYATYIYIIVINIYIGINLYIFMYSIVVIGLTMHATILAYMFTLIERGKIQVLLGPVPDNTLYIQEFVARLLKAAFPHLTDNQIKITVQGLFHLNQDITAFKEHLRDFLVQIKVSNIQHLCLHRKCV